MMRTNALDTKITFVAPKNDNAATIMHQGQTRTFVLKGVTMVEKIIVKCAEDMPKNLAWKEYDGLEPQLRKLVDDLVPDLRKDGTPKSKFANKWMLLFADKVKADRKFYFEGDGWTKSDVAFFTTEDNQPWSNFKQLLESLGPELEAGKVVTFGDYLKVGMECTATLVMGTDGYLHIDPATLAPVFNLEAADIVSETVEAAADESKPTVLSAKAENLLSYLEGAGKGMAIEDIEDEDRAAFAEVQKFVKSYTEDKTTIAITRA